MARPTRKFQINCYVKMLLLHAGRTVILTGIIESNLESKEIEGLGGAPYVIPFEDIFHTDAIKVRGSVGHHHR